MVNLEHQQDNSLLMRAVNYGNATIFKKIFKVLHDQLSQPEVFPYVGMSAKMTQ